MRTGAMVSEGRRTLGFTILEVVASMVVFGVVITAALSFLQIQNQGFRKGLDYMASTQAVREALGALERDIQTAGTNLVTGQPAIVYAGEHVLAFNADYATRIQGDALAVFFDPDLDETVTSAWLKSRRETLPHTAFPYPDTTYSNGAGLPGSAETLIFFFEKDGETPRTDDFALYRQVNQDGPRLVARNLLRVGEQPFFRYFVRRAEGIDSLRSDILPLSHEAPVHGGPADTGRVSMVDNIHGIRLTLASTNGRGGEEERISAISRILRMPNVEFGGPRACGRVPSLAAGPSVALNVSRTGETVVDLTWAPSPDDGMGEKDVVRYLVWRRVAGSGDWKEPYLSIPAGLGRYIYQDADLGMGITYEYAVAAQDCTPAFSARSGSPPITIPLS